MHQPKQARHQQIRREVNQNLAEQAKEEEQTTRTKPQPPFQKKPTQTHEQGPRFNYPSFDYIGNGVWCDPWDTDHLLREKYVIRSV